jgi:hypothetical protein
MHLVYPGQESHCGTCQSGVKEERAWYHGSTLHTTEDIEREVTTKRTGDILTSEGWQIYCLSAMGTSVRQRRESVRAAEREESLLFLFPV